MTALQGLDPEPVAHEVHISERRRPVVDVEEVRAGADLAEDHLGPARRGAGEVALELEPEVRDV